ncbi:MAG TPA: glutamine amidotransferase [Chthonomonadaceae bacterium]|nr:glutamine amidotransferase [Chthonomonadaceae bacterium]
MPIQFTFWPALLLLPVLLPYFWWLHRNTITDLSPGRKRLALAVRCVLATLLVLALAGTRFVRKGESLAVIFLADGSKSIRDDQRAAMASYLHLATKGMRTVDKVGLITFAQDPHTQSSPGQPFDPERLHDPGATSSTDIAQALRQAQNELDTTARDSGKRIVLLSDGNENAGRALAEMPELAADHIVLDTVTLPVSLPKEALIDKMVLPPRVKIGEPFPVRVVLSSLTAQTATVTLSRDDRPAGPAKQVDLHPGKNVVVFDQNIDKVGFFRYDATLNAPEDTIPDNNKGEGFVWVRGKPTVLYVADDPSLTSFLRRALQSENIDVQYAPPEAMPTTAAALQRFDSVFLSNVRADSLSYPQMTALQVACRDFGIGFGMVGGENSYGAGGYRGTPIEDVLPVTMDVKKQKRIPSVAVALVIEDLEIPTTVNMSKEAAKATMDLLEPIDWVGVLDCSGMSSFSPGASTSPGGTWRIPMQHVTDRDALKAKMDSLEDMGDPPNYDPYLLEAARVLNTATDAKVKHILFLGDGDAVYEASQGGTANTIKKIRGMGITISSIATGADSAGIKFMATLAYLGAGQAYVADRPQDLPRLMLKDQQTISQPPIIEEPFHPVPIEGDEILKGIDWNTTPPLLGYNISNLKPTAELSLASHRNDPIFAAWRYGLGRSVAFMSDDRAKWAAQWLGWPGYAKFWAQTVRWTLRPFAPSDYSTQVVMEGNRGHIVVDAIDTQGHYVNKLDLQARIAPPTAGGLKGSPTLDEPLRQTAPGHYEGWFDAPQIGTYLVNVLNRPASGKGPVASTVVGLSTAYSPEYKDTQANTYLMTQLAQLGGGRVDPAPAAVFGGDRPAIWSYADIVPLLLLLAMLLLPFDIAVRRLAIDMGDVQRALAWAVGKRVKAPKGRAATPELGRLLDRKEAVTTLREDRVLATNGDAAPEPVTPIPPTPTAPPVSRAPDRPVPAAPPSLSRMLRPETPEPTPAPAEESAPEATPQESGMSRLMAAKRRAQQKVEGDEK